MPERTIWRFSRGDWRSRQEDYDINPRALAWLDGWQREQALTQTEPPNAPQESCDSTKPVPTARPVRDSHSDV
jgi:hypothetical protein